MGDYKDTKTYWDHVFNAIQSRKIASKKSGYEALDRALDMLSENSTTYLDYGCGSGAILAYLAKRKKGVYHGIDLSPNAIRLAAAIFKENELETGRFEAGSIALLKKIPDETYDAIVASNVLDNLMPDDVEETVFELTRILRPQGKWMIKLNAHHETKTVQTQEMVKLQEDFYLEKSGLYLWNKPNAYWTQLLKNDYKIIKQESIFLGPHNHENRLFICMKRSPDR